MATLALEDHLLRLIDHQQTVQAYLRRMATDWSCVPNLPAGEVLFLEEGTGRILLSSPVKLLGTEDTTNQTFCFSWSDPDMHGDAAALAGLGHLRVAAREAGLTVFDTEGYFPIPSSAQARGWALQAAGLLGSYFVFEHSREGKRQYLAVQEFPFAETLPERIDAVKARIEDTLARYSVGHRAALEAYLGKPSRGGSSTLTQETLFWRIGQSELRAVFGHNGKLLDLGIEAPPERIETPTLPVEPPHLVARPGLLTRFFGKRNG